MWLGKVACAADVDFLPYHYVDLQIAGHTRVSQGSHDTFFILIKYIYLSSFNLLEEHFFLNSNSAQPCLAVLTSIFIMIFPSPPTYAG